MNSSYFTDGDKEYWYSDDGSVMYSRRKGSDDIPFGQMIIQSSGFATLHKHYEGITLEEWAQVSKHAMNPDRTRNFALLYGAGEKTLAKLLSPNRENRRKQKHERKAKKRL